MMLLKILEFYSTCKAPTKREIERDQLGLSEKEYVYLEEFRMGKSDWWLVCT